MIEYFQLYYKGIFDFIILTERFCHVFYDKKEDEFYEKIMLYDYLFFGNNMDEFGVIWDMFSKKSFFASIAYQVFMIWNNLYEHNQDMIELEMYNFSRMKLAIQNEFETIITSIDN